MILYLDLHMKQFRAMSYVGYVYICITSNVSLFVGFTWLRTSWCVVYCKTSIYIYMVSVWYYTKWLCISLLHFTFFIFHFTLLLLFYWTSMVTFCIIKHYILYINLLGFTHLGKIMGQKLSAMRLFIKYMSSHGANIGNGIFYLCI